MSTASPSSLDAFIASYTAFLTENKTERQIVDWATSVSRSVGFHVELLGTAPQTSIEHPTAAVPPAQSGPICFAISYKAVALFVPGRRPASEGLTIIGAHLDTPHIDLKPNTLKLDPRLVLTEGKGHHHGGIKKYQWAGIPLRLIAHGGNRTFDTEQLGTVVSIPFDPPDSDMSLAPKILEGKSLVALLASQLSKTEAVELLKRMLKAEPPFHDVEFSLYPSYPPRYVGMDKTMIGACGQDDGSGTYCAVAAACSMVYNKVTPTNSVLVVCYDNEETGSDGLCGAKSNLLNLVISRILELELEQVEGRRREVSQGMMNRCFAHSVAFSCDVTAGIDAQPEFSTVHDTDKCCGGDTESVTNSAVLGAGVSVEKTPMTDLGLLSSLRRLISTHCPSDCRVQFRAFGTGPAGGGTILEYLVDHLNCPGVDIGIPILGMHSPFEVAHCADLWALHTLLENIMRHFSLT